MLWKYFLFETKVLVNNRKNWFLGIVIMLFFSYICPLHESNAIGKLTRH